MQRSRLRARFEALVWVALVAFIGYRTWPGLEAPVQAGMHGRAAPRRGSRAILRHHAGSTSTATSMPSRTLSVTTQ